VNCVCTSHGKEVYGVHTWCFRGKREGQRVAISNNSCRSKHPISTCDKRHGTAVELLPLFHARHGSWHLLHETSCIKYQRRIARIIGQKSVRRLFEWQLFFLGTAASCSDRRPRTHMANTCVFALTNRGMCSSGEDSVASLPSRIRVFREEACTPSIGLPRCMFRVLVTILLAMPLVPNSSLIISVQGGIIIHLPQG
jgi:hypothetical protein